jgi:hypothetical protein
MMTLFLKNKKILLFFMILVIPLMGMLSGFEGQQKEDDQEPLKYQVEVDAYLVPFFAVDKEGKPVYSLEEKDIEFFVNGKPFPIAHLSRFQFQGDRAAGGDKINPQARYPERFVFIILDYMFNSRRGIQRSRVIADQIMQKSSPGDAFILLANFPRKGLEYLFGPEKDKKALARAIKDIFPGKVNKKSDITKSKKKLKKARQHLIGFHDAGAASSDVRTSKFNPYRTRTQSDHRDMLEMRKKILNAKEGLKEKLREFKYAIVSLKYALRSITASKIIYLISEGIPMNTRTRSMDNEDVMDMFTNTAFFFDYLEEIAKSVNFGGSILHVVDSAESPITDVDLNYSPTEGTSLTRTYKKRSLKFLAKKSGGTYFASPDVGKIVTGIKNYTAAYYEIVFMKDPSLKKMSFQIKSKKPGVVIHSIIRGEKQTPYRKMPRLQKEVFVLNVITGGTWSRMVGKVTKTKYKKIKSKGKNTRRIEVVIPGHMRNRKNDIFIVHLDPVTMKADFEYAKRKPDEKESLEIQMDRERVHFFVIIEPQTSSCIYNLVR